MKRPQIKVTRDGTLFTVGLLGIAHETLISQVDRPTLLFAFMAMVGLPAFLRADEKDKAAPKDSKPPTEPKPGVSDEGGKS